MNEWWLISGLFLLLIIALVVALYPLRKPAISIMLLSPHYLFYRGFCLLALGCFTDWNRYIHQEASSNQIQTMLKSIRSPQDLVDKLKVRLAKQPNSVKGWYLLGKLYASRDEWQQARDAFARAYQLRPEDVQNAVNYAQVYLQLNNQHF